MTIQIQHNITGTEVISDLTLSINALIAKFDSLGNNLNGAGLNNDTADLGSSTKATPGANMADNPMTILTESIKNSTTVQSQLVNKINLLTEQFTKMNRSIENDNDAGGGGGGNDSSDPGELAKNNGKNKTNSNRAALGFGVGMGVALSYELGSLGSTIGSAGGALNVGAAHYTEFETEYANRKLSNEQSMISTGTSMLPALGFMAPGGIVGKSIATLGLTALSAGVNYFSGEHFEGEKQANEQKRQDLISWRLSNMGMSPMSDTSMLGNVKLTEFQKQSLTNKYAQYDATAADVAFNGKRDVMSTILKNGGSGDFNKNINDLMRLTGNNNAGQWSGLATQMSSMTGISPNDALVQMMKDQTNYGGDTAANTGKMLELLKNTAVSPQQAHDLVNRYQFNEPMLQNKVANINMPQSAQFLKEIWMRIGGASESEISTGTWTTAHTQQALALQRSKNHALAMVNKLNLGYTHSFDNQPGGPWANEANSVESSGVLGNRKPTSMMSEDFGQKVLDSLKNINTVSTSGNIYLNGKIEQSGREYPAANVAKNTSAKPLANPGVTQKKNE